MTKWVYSFGGGNAEGGGEMRELLGGKGAGLAEMARRGGGDLQFVARAWRHGCRRGVVAARQKINYPLDHRLAYHGRAASFNPMLFAVTPALRDASVRPT